MNSEILAKLALLALDDLKGKDIIQMDVKDHCDFTDIMIFCTGTSNRHVKSLASNVADEVKKQGEKVLGIEGESQGEWVLLDLGDVVVHVMLEEIREFYQIEELWEISPEDHQSNEN